MSHRKVNLVFSEEAYQDIEMLSENMHVSTDKVIGQAITLLKWVQGRRVILKDEKQSVEVHNFKNLPSKVDIKT